MADEELKKSILSVYDAATNRSCSHISSISVLGIESTASHLRLLWVRMIVSAFGEGKLHISNSRGGECLHF